MSVATMPASIEGGSPTLDELEEATKMLLGGHFSNGDQEIATQPSIEISVAPAEDNQGKSSGGQRQLFLFVATMLHSRLVPAVTALVRFGPRVGSETKNELIFRRTLSLSWISQVCVSVIGLRSHQSCHVHSDDAL